MPRSPCRGRAQSGDRPAGRLVPCNRRRLRARPWPRPRRLRPPRCRPAPPAGRAAVWGRREGRRKIAAAGARSHTHTQPSLAFYYSSLFCVPVRPACAASRPAPLPSSPRPPRPPATPARALKGRHSPFPVPSRQGVTRPPHWRPGAPHLNDLVARPPRQRAAPFSPGFLLSCDSSASAATVGKGRHGLGVVWRGRAVTRSEKKKRPGRRRPEHTDFSCLAGN